MKRLHRQLKKYGIFTLASIILVLLSIIPIRIAIASYQAPYPQAILTLGGDSDREQFTAQFARKYPTLDIWVSSGIPPNQAHAIFENADIPNSRLHLDYRAVDTVTNFTSLVWDFKKRHIQHLYLITSDFHLPRATSIAILVLGSQGITFTSISIPSKKPRESKLHILRDIGRSFFWIISGRTGASLNPNIK
jgi:uncharacterized SAM-binding protein YcdF (DUF218 family)